MSRAVFSSEAGLCATFIASLPKDWIAYPETCHFDIVLLRPEDGCQVAIEAKLVLNAKVIHQIAEEANHYRATSPGPDFRAVLVPRGCDQGLAGICHMIGVTIIEQHDRTTWTEAGRYHRHYPRFSPDLPLLPKNSGEWWHSRDWVDFAPAQRLKLPEYVPDVRAGHASPVQLTDWKIKAIKIAIIAERRGYLTREDFKIIGIDHRRFIEPGGWARPGAIRGQYVPSGPMGNFKKAHPRNYAEIEADFPKWNPDLKKLLGGTDG